MNAELRLKLFRHMLAHSVNLDQQRRDLSEMAKLADGNLEALQLITQADDDLRAIVKKADALADRLQDISLAL